MSATPILCPHKIPPLGHNRPLYSQHSDPTALCFRQIHFKMKQTHWNQHGNFYPVKRCIWGTNLLPYCPTLEPTSFGLWQI